MHTDVYEFQMNSISRLSAYLTVNTLHFLCYFYVRAVHRVYSFLFQPTKHYIYIFIYLTIFVFLRNFNELQQWISLKLIQMYRNL